MARWATTAIIAGVDLSGCRVELLDAYKFLSKYVGSTTWANSGNANAQVVNVGVKGNVFGVTIRSAEITDLLDIAEAIEDATDDLQTFVINVVDDMYTINHYCNRLYGSRPWISHGKNSEGWVEEITMWFVSRAVVT